MLRTHTHHLEFKGTQKHKQLGGSSSTLGCCFATLMKLTTRKKNFRSPHDQLADFSTLNERLGNGFTYTPRHVKTMNATVDFYLNYCDGNIDALKTTQTQTWDSLWLGWRCILRAAWGWEYVCVCNTSNVNRLLWKRKFIAPGYERKKTPPFYRDI